MVKNSNVQIEFTRRAADQYATGVGCYSVQDAIQAVIDQDHAEAFKDHYPLMLRESPYAAWDAITYAQKGDYEMACAILYDLRDRRADENRSATLHPLVTAILNRRRMQSRPVTAEARMISQAKLSGLEDAARMTLSKADLARLFPDE